MCPVLPLVDPGLRDAHRGLNDRQRLYATAEGLGIDHDGDRGDQRRRDRITSPCVVLTRPGVAPRSGGLFAPVFPTWRIGPFAIAQPLAPEPDARREVPGRGVRSEPAVFGGGAGFTCSDGAAGVSSRTPTGARIAAVEYLFCRATHEQTSTTSLQEDA